MKNVGIRKTVHLVFSLMVAACSGTIPAETIGNPGTDPQYGEVQEGYMTIPAVDPGFLQEPNRRKSVVYYGSEIPGT
ncbi:MAG: hypothetical protein KJN60_04505, partial [Boseongicola sp.]|nr:hypothetical protein [Boseongicola sp.]